MTELKTLKDFEKRLIEQFVKLIDRADLDRIITGNSYWEFTDRKIEVINPKNIKYSKKKGIIIQPRRLTKQNTSFLGGVTFDAPKKESGK